MNFDREVDFATSTDGRGHWSDTRSIVVINRIALVYVNEEGNFGELRAYFDTENWDVATDGLIYTDKLWKRVFLAQIKNTLGFSSEAILDIDYSEAGMQGNNYVSMDVGAQFLLECDALYRFTIHKEVVN